MSDDVQAVAAAFVDMALSHGRCEGDVALEETEVQVLFRTVVAAGFEVSAVVPGRLLGHYRDQDGSATGETYAINALCPYKAQDEDGTDHTPATRWLDHALSRVVRGEYRWRPREDRDGLVTAIAAEIARSVPLVPVQLTPEGDLLCEYPPSGLGGFVDHTRDGKALSTCAGVHKYCNGWMDRLRATARHDAIVCRNCHLRVLFPRTVTTYGELRAALRFPEQQAAE